MSGRIIAERVANALIPAAETDLLGTSDGIAKSFKEFYGGLWVGGKVRLTSSELGFEPNAPNRAVHQPGPLSQHIPLTDIESVAVNWGFITRIISVTTKTQTFKVRCFKADALADEIRAAAVASKERQAD